MKTSTYIHKIEKAEELIRENANFWRYDIEQIKDFLCLNYHKISDTDNVIFERVMSLINQ